MSIGRVLSSITACAAVAGCAVVVVGMAGTHRGDTAEDRPLAGATRTAPPIAATHPSTEPGSSAAAATSHPARATVGATAPRASDPSAAAPASTAPTATTATATTATAPDIDAPHVPAAKTDAGARTTSTARPAAPHAVAATHAAAAHRAATPSAAHHASAPRAATQPTGSPLPLHYKTYYSTRVITVRSYSAGSTTAVLQAWTKAAGGGWNRYGSSVTAHVGAAGIGTASESTSKTPAGAFTLTQAFGHFPDPGTALPYLHTTPSDWWISQPGPLYNTHQRCSSGCGFTHGSPNEHLYYETPFYNYGVVIDYNTRNAPGGVHAGKGSAFFLHVTDGAPTAGCVSIPQDKLVSIMRWLTPSAHPRILIGVT